MVEAKLFTYTFSAAVQAYPDEYRPDWGRMSFLVDILRPTPGEGPSWYHLLKKASGGCNDLMYSGHMLVAVLTAMAWTVYVVVLIHISQRLHHVVQRVHHNPYDLTFVLSIYLFHRKHTGAGSLLQYGSSSCTAHRGRYVSGTTTAWTVLLQSTSASSCGG